MDQSKLKLTKICDKGVILSESGYVYWPENQNGYLTEDCLRFIANILEEKNAKLFEESQRNIGNE